MQGSINIQTAIWILTGARTSHQMGREIGYERWPAIKSDFPQCHLSDSDRGIMTTANESWALVRPWFKSAPPFDRPDVLTQYFVLLSTPTGCMGTKEQETLDIILVPIRTHAKKESGTNITHSRRGPWLGSKVHTEYSCEEGENECSVAQGLVVTEVSTCAFQSLDTFRWSICSETAAGTAMV